MLDVVRVALGSGGVSAHDRWLSREESKERHGLKLKTKTVPIAGAMTAKETAYLDGHNARLRYVKGTRETDDYFNDEDKHWFLRAAKFGSSSLFAKWGEKSEREREKNTGSKSII